MGNPFHVLDVGPSRRHRYTVELACGCFQCSFFKKYNIAESGFLWEKAASYFWKTQSDCLYPVFYDSEPKVFRVHFDSLVLARAFANSFYKQCRSSTFLFHAFSIKK